ncbi:hypothetical protein E3W21_01065 [Pseudomonas sp. F01002]|nr:hypothetical protein E3W21_01065 [Pseudomonas sp. F01002]
MTAVPYADACDLCTAANPLWERACSRRRCNIQHLCWMTHRFREQARSHIGPVVFSAIGFQA